MDAGRKTLTQRANEKAVAILEDYQPEPLPKNVEKKLRDIVERAEQKISK